ncbi:MULTISPECIES: DUF1858 domain-containing protein [Aminobacter]|uniref:Hybrid cluster-associated redox disulfide protein n=1 Tax=Aminobacter aminovorans TaxID=83263 RepID=A0ABR6H5B8_AMIAI|nr:MULTISPECIES: DUF1858 domain-containing protein [Aminobacter]MBB3705692.1 hybrid cluster-associated redox disulfide protein [Aminobacter aminovorans]MRX36694.1 DUF1858 domain-containing protein [Aminobacter sp. MDW-2]QNH33858.1 DUF1858 domain-containing protein [Aminobacter sp. MDW-2]
MASSKRFDPDLAVDDVMKLWPNTIRVFLANRMLCVGCPIGSFHTVSDACREYELDETSFLNQLAAAIDRQANAG